MFLFSAIMVSVTTVVVYAHNCQQYDCSQSGEVSNSGSNYLELYSQSPSGITFNFDVNLDGNGEFICLDLGVCTANNGGASTLYISYQSTNSGHWTADLAIAFYGTGQTFGGCECRGPNCQCGNTIVGSFPTQYKQFVRGNVQVNSNFNPALASGFTAICAVNTCGGGTCVDYNRFYGSFIISHLNCTAAPVTTGHPLIVPIQAPTAPTVYPTSGRPSFGPTIKPSKVPTIKPSFASPTYRPTRVPTKKPTTVPSTIVPTEPSAEPTVNPSDEPSAEPTGPSSNPSTAPSNPTSSPSLSTTIHPTHDPSFEPTFYPTYDPTIDELIGE